MKGAIWQNPQAFWLLWLIPLVVLLALHAHRRVRRAAASFLGEVMTSRLMPSLGPLAPAQKTALFAVGLVLLVVAAARPAWGVYYSKSHTRGLDLVVALDVSRSMLADDGGETRLARARTAVAWLVDAIPNDRVGLICFAGESLQAVPLTLDRGFFKQVLAGAGPDLVGKGGTALGPALDEARAMLDNAFDRDKLCLLVTDGDDQESFPLDAATRMKKLKIRVITLGLGRSGSTGPLVVNGRVVRKKDGSPVLARLNEGLLKKIALKTGGMYVPPEDADRLAALYRRYIKPLRKGANEELQEKHHHERYQWFLLPAILFLLLSMGRWPYPRRRGNLSGARVALVLLCALVLGVFGCGRSGAATSVEAGLAALKKGSPKQAVTLFKQAEKKLPEDPVVAFDLGCALQQGGQLEAAEGAYARALETGLGGLRARAYANLGLLHASRCRKRVEAGDPLLSKEQRQDIRREADEALDMLQVARNLDPKLQGLGHKQDLLAAWLRNAEDRWAAHDREAAKRERQALQGPAFLKALMQAEERLLARLQGDALLENVILQQRQLATQEDELKPRLEASKGGVQEAFKKDAEAALKKAQGAFAAGAELLLEARIPEGDRALGQGSAGLLSVYLLWGEPDQSLTWLIARQGRLARALALLTARRDKQHTKPPDALVDALLKEQLQITAWIDLLRRRVAPGMPKKSWPKPWVARASELLPKARAESVLAASLLPGDLRQASRKGTRVLAWLKSLQEEWGLAGMGPAPLARALEQQEGELLGGARLTLAARRTSPLSALVEGQQQLLGRLSYLGATLKRAAPAGKKGNQRMAKVLGQAQEQLKTKAQAALQSLQQAAVGVQSAAQPALEALAGARRGLRELWTRLAAPEALLGGAVAEQAALLAESRAVAGLVSSSSKASHQVPPSLSPAPLLEAAAEQALVASLASLLADRMPVLEQALKKKPAGRDSSSKNPRELPPEERKALQSAYHDLADLLKPAAREAQEAARLLGESRWRERDPGVVRQLVKLLEKGGQPGKLLRASLLPHLEARGHQEKALKDLQAAAKRLREARMSLPGLAFRLLQGEEALLPPLRELAGGRKAHDGLGGTLTLKQILGREEALSPYLKRLPSALARLQEQGSKAGGKRALPKEVLGKLKQQIKRVQTSWQNCCARMKEGQAQDSQKRASQTRREARALWLPFGGFKPLVKRAIQEERAVARITLALQQKGAQVPADLWGYSHQDQQFALELFPRLEAAFKTLTSKKKPAGASGQQQGLSKKTAALAAKNLPLAKQAMGQALAELQEREAPEALAHEDEAARLLAEILKSLEQDQKKQQQKKQQPPSSGQRPLTPAEQARLARAVSERNRRRKQKMKKRTPVQQDW